MLVALAGACLLLTISAMFSTLGCVWFEYDFRALDFFFRRAVAHGLGPKQSPQIVFVTITDATYNSLGRTSLDRGYMADVNDALSSLDIEALGYDLIFSRAGDADSDARFERSLRRMGSAYLPIGLGFSESASSFKWEDGQSFRRLRSEYIRKPVEAGTGKPFHATRALMQCDLFSDASRSSGHISALSDSDGVYRHMIMLLKVGDAYFPTLSLSMFLDYARVPFEKVLVEWGSRIVIPADGGSLLEKDVVIPIDERGCAYVPFPGEWDRTFKKMEVFSLLQRMDDRNLRGNLTDFFEGRFILLGDVSTGSADLGHTPLESDAPLILLHASMLNGMLTNEFYAKWSNGEVAAFMLALCVLMTLSALMRSSWFLYGTGAFVGLGLAGFTWLQFIHFRLFPVVSAEAGSVAMFLGLVATLELATGRERTFIKNAFSRYVPAKVVDILVAHPETLKFGGEERVMTVLFSDLEGFTSISEKISPTQLVQLLREYLTEMTNIVLAHGGIIDKYEGDAVMAEFGAPLPLPDHAERAVKAALSMQNRLKELRGNWSGRGLPALKCRVGVNTGPMIVGNMGSEQVFDYTVLGDAVNLASRLEGANKRYNTFLMISESTFQCLPAGRFRTRVLDVIRVKGKSKPVKVFEVYGEASDPVDPRDELYYRTYEEAFGLFLARDFGEAEKSFREALEIRPGDPACMDILERIEEWESRELPPDWDGSIALTSK